MWLSKIFHRDAKAVLTPEEQAVADGRKILTKLASFKDIDYEARTSETERVIKLIKAGADLTVKDDDGNTALMLIVINGYSYEDMLPRVLIKSDLAATDMMGDTALDIAVKKNHETYVRQLLDANAKVTARTVRYSDLRGVDRSDAANISRMLKVALQYQDKKLSRLLGIDQPLPAK